MIKNNPNQIVQPQLIKVQPVKAETQPSTLINDLKQPKTEGLEKEKLPENLKKQLEIYLKQNNSLQNGSRIKVTKVYYLEKNNNSLPLTTRNIETSFPTLTPTTLTINASIPTTITPITLPIETIPVENVIVLKHQKKDTKKSEPKKIYYKKNIIQKPDVILHSDKPTAIDAHVELNKQEQQPSYSNVNYYITNNTTTQNNPEEVKKESNSNETLIQIDSLNINKKNESVSNHLTNDIQIDVENTKNKELIIQEQSQPKYELFIGKNSLDKAHEVNVDVMQMSKPRTELDIQVNTTVKDPVVNVEIAEINDQVNKPDKSIEDIVEDAPKIKQRTELDIEVKKNVKDPVVNLEVTEKSTPRIDLDVQVNKTVDVTQHSTKIDNQSNNDEKADNDAIEENKTEKVTNQTNNLVLELPSKSIVVNNHGENKVVISETNMNLKDSIDKLHISGEDDLNDAIKVGSPVLVVKTTENSEINNQVTDENNVAIIKNDTVGNLDINKIPVLEKQNVIDFNVFGKNKVTKVNLYITKNEISNNTQKQYNIQEDEKVSEHYLQAQHLAAKQQRNVVDIQVKRSRKETITNIQKDSKNSNELEGRNNERKLLPTKNGILEINIKTKSVLVQNEETQDDTKKNDESSHEKSKQRNQDSENDQDDAQRNSNPKIRQSIPIVELDNQTFNKSENESEQKNSNLEEKKPLDTDTPSRENSFLNKDEDEKKPSINKQIQKKNLELNNNSQEQEIKNFEKDKPSYDGQNEKDHRNDPIATQTINLTKTPERIKTALKTKRLPIKEKSFLKQKSNEVEHSEDDADKTQPIFVVNSNNSAEKPERVKTALKEKRNPIQEKPVSRLQPNNSDDDADKTQPIFVVNSNNSREKPERVKTALKTKRLPIKEKSVLKQKSNELEYSDDDADKTQPIFVVNSNNSTEKPERVKTALQEKRNSIQEKPVSRLQPNNSDDDADKKKPSVVKKQNKEPEKVQTKSLYELDLQEKTQKKAKETNSQNNYPVKKLPQYQDDENDLETVPQINNLNANKKNKPNEKTMASQPNIKSKKLNTENTYSVPNPSQQKETNESDEDESSNNKIDSAPYENPRETKKPERRQPQKELKPSIDEAPGRKDSRYLPDENKHEPNNDNHENKKNDNPVEKRNRSPESPERITKNPVSRQSSTEPKPLNEENIRVPHDYQKTKIPLTKAHNISRFQPTEGDKSDNEDDKAPYGDSNLKKKKINPSNVQKRDQSPEDKEVIEKPLKNISKPINEIPKRRQPPKEVKQPVEEHTYAPDYQKKKAPETKAYPVSRYQPKDEDDNEDDPTPFKKTSTPQNKSPYQDYPISKAEPNDFYDNEIGKRPTIDKKNNDSSSKVKEAPFILPPTIHENKSPDLGNSRFPKLNKQKLQNPAVDYGDLRKGSSDWGDVDNNEPEGKDYGLKKGFSDWGEIDNRKPEKRDYGLKKGYSDWGEIEDNKPAKSYDYGLKRGETDWNGHENNISTKKPLNEYDNPKNNDFSPPSDYPTRRNEPTRRNVPIYKQQPFQVSYVIVRFRMIFNFFEL
jgi:hypothetical protein